MLFFSARGAAVVATIEVDAPTAAVPSAPQSICFWLRTRPEMRELFRVAWNDERNTVKFLPGKAGDTDTSSCYCLLRMAETDVDFYSIEMAFAAGSFKLSECLITF